MKSIIIGILFLLIGCNSPSVKKVCYTLAELENSNDSLTAKDYPADFSYVALETTDECLIREIDEVVMTADYFFVLDQMNKVYQFSVNGKFIRQIGRRGHGPQEYGRILSFAVNDSLKQVYLADYHKVLAFDFNGEYIGEYPADFWWKFNVTDDSCFLISPMNYLKASRSKFIVKKMVDNDTLAAFSNSQAPLSGLFPDTKAVFRLQEKYIFNQLLNDTVYTYDPRTCQLDLRYYFDFGAIKLTDKILSAPEGDFSACAYLTDITEDPVYVYVTYDNQGEERRKMIDKRTGKIYTQSRGIPLLESGFYWWPRWQCMDSILIAVIPGYYSQILKEHLSKTKLEKILYLQGEDANPILFLSILN